MDDPIRCTPQRVGNAKERAGFISHPGSVHKMKSLRVHADGTRPYRGRGPFFPANRRFSAIRHHTGGVGDNRDVDG
jgi:hypothetical protein